MTIFTVVFWQAALERALKSAVQGLIGSLVAGSVNVLELDWATLGGFAGGAFLLSILTSIASDVATGDGPSLTNAEVVPQLTAPGRRRRRDAGDIELRVVVWLLLFIGALVLLALYVIPPAVDLLQ